MVIIIIIIIIISYGLLPLHKHSFRYINLCVLTFHLDIFNKKNSNERESRTWGI